MYPLNIPGIGITNPHIYEEKQQQINSFIFSHCLNMYKENLHVCTYVQKCVINCWCTNHNPIAVL